MMTFSASAADLRLAAGGAIAAAALHAVLEWRRPNDHHRAWRLAASVAAVWALALLGVHPAWRPPRASHGSLESMAALCTPGATADTPPEGSIP